RLQPVPNDGSGGRTEENGRAQIPLHRSPDPTDELDEERLIEAQGPPQLLDLLLGSVRSQHERCGITRRQVNEQEGDDTYHEQHRDEGYRPARHNGAHENSPYPTPWAGNGRAA